MSEKIPVQPAADAAQVAEPQVVVTTKKRKRKYSRRLRDVQEIDRAMAKASWRLNQAVADGFDTYRKRSDHSARKKRDGAIRDGIENWARAMGKTMKKASSAPSDIARAFSSKRMKRRIRAVVRFFALPFRRS